MEKEVRAVAVPAEMTIAFNVEKRRPGCVNLQAVFGGTVPEFSRHFDNKTWLLSPEGIKLYRVTREQLPHLVKMAEEAVRSKRSKHG